MKRTLERAVDAVIGNNLLSLFRVLCQDSRTLPPTGARVQLVSVSVPPATPGTCQDLEMQMAWQIEEGERIRV